MMWYASLPEGADKEEFVFLPDTTTVEDYREGVGSDIDYPLPTEEEIEQHVGFEYFGAIGEWVPNEFAKKGIWVKGEDYDRFNGTEEDDE